MRLEAAEAEELTKGKTRWSPVRWDYRRVWLFLVVVGFWMEEEVIDEGEKSEDSQSQGRCQSGLLRVDCGWALAKGGRHCGVGRAGQRTRARAQRRTRLMTRRRRRLAANGKSGSNIAQVRISNGLRGVAMGSVIHGAMDARTSPRLLRALQPDSLDVCSGGY